MSNSPRAYKHTDDCGHAPRCVAVSPAPVPTPAMLADLRRWIGPAQLAAMRSGLRGEESAYFRERFAAVAATVAAMPATYAQDGMGDRAVAHLHYFTSGADWWITERDAEPEQLQAFGLADLFHDGGELGYISIVELLANGAELDLHFTPRTLAEVRAARVAS